MYKSVWSVCYVLCFNMLGWSNEKVGKDAVSVIEIQKYLPQAWAQLSHDFMSWRILSSQNSCGCDKSQFSTVSFSSQFKCFPLR